MQITNLSDWRNYINDSIIAPLIDRDIMGLQRIQKPALMRQLIELSIHYSGQIISDYLNLLSDAGIIIALSRYTPSPHIGKATLCKLNVLNTALMTTTLPSATVSYMHLSHCGAVS